MNKDAIKNRHDKIMKNWQESLVKEEIEKVYESIYRMNWGMYILGFILIIVPLILYVIRGDTDIFLIISEVIGFADIIALLLVKPMERNQTNLGNLMQATMIMYAYSYEMGTLLTEISEGEEDTKDEKESLKELRKELTACTKEYSDLIQKYLRLGGDVATKKGDKD
ncbi:MAG: hypothetical protein SVM80_02345 [Halobacteriota archaeon]|nr:hypothetical protein [Halobacteriota archaeon]